MTERESQIKEFLHQAGWGAAERGRLAGDASFRRYDRLALNGQRAVLMDAPPPMENVRPFLAIGGHLVALGYSAPRLLAADEENGLLLLEDLGDDTFTRLLGDGVAEADLYGLAVDLLIDLHKKGPAAMPDGLPPFSDERLLREVMLLLDWYYPEMMGGPVPEALRQDYGALWRELIPIARQAPDSLVMFDFHVDNLMRLPDRSGLAACGLLDFQDAVAGPISYDVMSLLEDARRDIDPALIKSLRQRYMDHFPTLDRQAFEASWAVLAAQRHCRVIGVFTRLYRRDKKPHYLQHIPRCWRLLGEALAHPALQALDDWFEKNLPPAQRLAPHP